MFIKYTLPLVNKFHNLVINSTQHFLKKRTIYTTVSQFNNSKINFSKV